VARDLTAEIISELIAGAVHVALLVELETSAGTVRVWSGIGELVFNGETFLGVGHLGGIGPIQESGQEVRANAITLQLSGIPAALISTALETQYQGRQARIWLAFFTAGAFSAPALVEDAVLIFRGRADTMQILDGPETATITVTLESRLADLTRPRVRRYTHEDQVTRFPGDLGLEFVTEVQNREITWGGEGSTIPAGFGLHR
jgi:hypothetical protein